MNRLSRESQFGGGRNGMVGSASLLLQQRRAKAGAAGRDGGDEGLDLFSRNRRSVPAVSAFVEGEMDGQNGPANLGSISAVSAKMPRSGMDDLLTGADMGKHDYDWLLTPPGTPLSPLLDARECPVSSVEPRSNLSARAVSANKASRFSASQADNDHPTTTKLARSSSLTRPSLSSAFSGHLSNSRTSVLNTSMASITSYRPSTPSKRPTTASSTTKQTTSRPTSSRSSTPIKTRPISSSPMDKAASSSADRTQPLHGTRPSTTTARPQIPVSITSSLSSVAARTNSRPSTPTRRAPAPSPTPLSTRPSTPIRKTSAHSSSPVSARPSTPTRRTTVPVTPAYARSSSVGRVPDMNSRNPGLSRPASPSPRIRTYVQPIVPPEFPLDVPPNLRTKLPERPVSAGRTRPGAALTAWLNLSSEALSPANPTRRQSSSPSVTRGRLPVNSSKTQSRGTDNETTPPETQKSMDVTKKAAKPATTTESTGFGRTISKKSLDMALRHMDIRQSIGGIRGASLFPQSIRSTAPKGRAFRVGADTDDNDCSISISDSYNGAISENGDSITMSPDRDFHMKRATQSDVYESTRYDTILLKEDSKNMSWLHSIEDKSDQSPLFDHRFEPLPEPFALP